MRDKPDRGRLVGLGAWAPSPVAPLPDDRFPPLRTMEQALADLNAKYRALPVTDPERAKLSRMIVPREPTDTVLDAMRAAAAYRLALPDGVEGEREKYRRRWQAGIDAAIKGP